MDIHVKMLRDKLHELLNGERIIASNEILKISEELDQLTVNHFIVQTKDQLRNDE